MTQKIAILTGGGDAPGLNAVIRAVVLAAREHYGWEVVGIREGFDGLLDDKPLIDLTNMDVHDLLARGGTILGAASRGNPFVRPVQQADGTIINEDRSQEALDKLKLHNIDALICAGGDGTMAIAYKLAQKGAHIIGVPKTIDNDLGETDVTFGFDTAVNTATDALEKLRTTAESHHRIMVMEVMGRNAGWIALTSGIAGGADAILIPEIPFDLNVVCAKIDALREAGRMYSLIVVAEGAHPADGERVYHIEGTTAERRLGGVGQQVGVILAECTGSEVRVTVLGHVQRGGQPTPHDRYLATLFGTEAVHCVAEEQWGRMVAMTRGDITTVPMAEAVAMKFVDPNGEIVRAARDLGIVFG